MPASKITSRKKYEIKNPGSIRNPPDFFKRAKEQELKVGIYSSQLFTTMNQQDNLDETAKYTDEEQDLVGLAVYGEGKKVSKAIDGLKFHE